MAESERKSQFPETRIPPVVAVDTIMMDGWTSGRLGKNPGWRNLGLSGFQEQTVQLGPGEFDGGGVSEIHFADFDMDCDSDVIVALANGGLRYLRDEGGNANSQAKVKMV